MGRVVPSRAAPADDLVRPCRSELLFSGGRGRRVSDSPRAHRWVEGRGRGEGGTQVQNGYRLTNGCAER